MRKTRVGLAAGALAVLGGGVATGLLLSGGGAVAADDDPTTGASAAAGAPRHDHVDVTGAELTRITDAVEAEEPSVTVESVRQDPDGSYDVLGTEDGAPVMLEVSADLATIKEHTGGHGDADGHGGHRGHGGGPDGGSQDTPVTGAELTRVTDAVEADDAGVTVESVRQDPDGSYDVVGTKGGGRVMLEVSADLATIAEHTGGRGGPGDRGGRGDRDGADAPGGAVPSSGATTSAYVVPA